MRQSLHAVNLAAAATTAVSHLVHLLVRPGGILSSCVRAGTYLRLGFEGSYCINVVTRLVTLPWRRSLPDFYIVGFPVRGADN